MCWTVSQALVAEYSLVCYLGTDQFVPSKLMRTVDQFLYGDKTMDTSRRSRFGMTSEHLTDEHGEALLTFYRVASLARTSVPPETAPELPEKNHVSGLKCSVSFGRYDRSTSSWKTPLNLFGEDSTLSSAAWSKAGTMRNGYCWERTTWVPRTDENDVGFSENFPTPKARDWKMAGMAAEMKRKSPSLPAFVRMFPTPQASDAKRTGTHPAEWRRDSPSLPAVVQMFPTPTVNGNHNRAGLSKNSGDGLATFVKRFRTPDTHAGGRSGLLAKGITHRKNGQPVQVRLVDQVGGKLNPVWVEWLMGFPLGWTDLKVLATPKSRCVPPSRGKRCMKKSMKSEVK